MTLEELQKLKELESLKNERSTIARAGTALANSIAGLGASADVRSQQNKEIAGYLKATEPEPIKDLKTIDVDGKPVFMDIPNARFEQAYQAPKASSGGKGSYQAIQYYDPKTKKYGSYKFNTGTGELEPIDVIVRPVADKLFSTTDVQGTEKQKTYNQYDKNPVATVDTEAGLGTHYKVATKGQAETIEKGVQKGQEEMQKTSDSLFEVKQAKNTLSTTKDPRVAASAIYEMVRNVEPKGVLTDADFVNITGTDKRTFYANLQDIISAKITGDISSVTKSYIPMVEKLEKKLSNKIKTVGTRYAPSSEQGQGAFKNVTPTQDPLNWKDKYK